MAERDRDWAWKQSKLWDWSYLENEAEGGCSAMPCFSIVSPNEYWTSSSSTNIPTHRMPPRPSHVTYHLFPESSSSTVFPFNTLPHDHYVNQQMMHTEGHGFLGSVGNERGFLKRKWTSMPIDNDHRYKVGRSLVGKSYSNWHQHPISDFHLHQEFESIRYNSPCTEPSRQSSQRNIRSRHSLQNDDVARRHFPTTFSSQPLGNLPGLGSERQWNHGIASAYHGKAPFSDPGASTSETNGSYSGSSSRNSPHVGNGIHRHSTQFRNLYSPLSVQGHAQIPGTSSSNHNQRAPSYWRHFPSFYKYSELAPSHSDGNEQSVPEDISRRSMPISIGGYHHSGGRRGRMKDSYGRLHSVPTMTNKNTHGRWMPPRGYTAIGRGIYFGTSITFDRHEDMRLDVDNMSYEELLDLEDRIGNVNTGLSEDAIVTCLTRTVYSCPSVEVDNDSDAKNCAICLENYKVGEEIGSLKCRHGYHFCCIQKWLEIKNSCPICKASALEK